MKAVIFDMDGVLIDSEPLYMQFVIDFFHQHHQQISLQEVVKLAGSNAQDSWRMMGEWWYPKKNPEEMKLYYETHINHEKVDFTQLLNPYVHYILPRLKKAGYRLAIASSSSYKEINEMCQTCHLFDYFDVVVSGEQFQRSKPDPEIYQHTMDLLQVQPQDCFVIEDSDYGIEAGKAAGATVIAKIDQRFSFDQKKAQYKVYDLFEAMQLILKGECYDREEN